MSRQFNPDLFKSGGPDEGSQMATSQVESLKRRVRDLELQNHQMQQKLEQLALFHEQKISQLSAQQKTAENTFREQLADMARNQSALGQRLTERKAVDMKMQELIDRHNQLVQNFDGRLATAQKVTKEQELKLVSYQATLTEILREIRALQR